MLAIYAVKSYWNMLGAVYNNYGIYILAILHVDWIGVILLFGSLLCSQSVHLVFLLFSMKSTKVQTLSVVLCKQYNVHVLYCWGLRNVIGHVCVICKSCVRALYNVCGGGGGG